MSKKNIEDLRELLFETIAGVKNGTLDIDRAKVIGDLSQVMVNSARAEVEFAKVTGLKGSGFLQQAEQLPQGITGVRQHKMLG